MSIEPWGHRAVRGRCWLGVLYLYLFYMYITNRPGQLSLPSLQGRWLEYRPACLGLRSSMSGGWWHSVPLIWIHVKSLSVKGWLTGWFFMLSKVLKHCGLYVCTATDQLQEKSSAGIVQTWSGDVSLSCTFLHLLEIGDANLCHAVLCNFNMV